MFTDEEYNRFLRDLRYELEYLEDKQDNLIKEAQACEKRCANIRDILRNAPIA